MGTEAIPTAPRKPQRYRSTVAHLIPRVAAPVGAACHTGSRHTVGVVSPLRHKFARSEKAAVYDCAARWLVVLATEHYTLAQQSAAVAVGSGHHVRCWHRACTAPCAATTSLRRQVLWGGGSCTSMDDALQHRWVCVGEHRIFTRVWMRLAPATRPHLGPVVLVHGLGVSSRYMIPTAIRLSRYQRVYAPDLPGFGASSRPVHALSVSDLAHVLTLWLDKVGLARAVFLGNSLGCQVLAHVAVAHPEIVAQAILVGPTMDPSAGAFGQVGRLLCDAFAEPPSYLPLLIRDYLRAGPLRTLATFRLGLRDRTFALYPAMAMPTLIVRGARDPIAPQLWAMALAERVPHGSLAVIPGKGHAATYNAPDALVDLIHDFLIQSSCRS